MKRSVTVVTLLCWALGFFIPAQAQKPGAASALVKIPVEQQETYLAGNMRLEKATGIARAVYHANFKATAADPIIMAKQYLRENADLLGLKADLSDLSHFVTRETAGGFHVRFNQHVANIPVYRGEIAVTIDRNNVVTFVANGYQKGVQVESTIPGLTREQALQRAKSHLQTRGELNLEKADLIVYFNNGVARLALKTVIVPAESPAGDWEIFVDAKSGEIFRVENKAYHYRDRGRAAGVAATGTGQVFDPDPITRSGSTYGTGGLTDNNDADNADLTAQVTSVTLPDITFTGSLYQLKGPYAEVVDSESPKKGLFTQASSTFNFTRNADAFEAVNVYYHIDKSMRYINTTLGVPLMPFQYTGGVRVDPHGLNGQDNSHYTSSTGQLAFGEGGVDDAEDLEVVLHELGHGLHDWASNGQISQVDGLSEGCGDYWAASYTRSLGFWLSSEPEYNWVMRWDGHNPFWGGRIVNYSAHYPDGLTGSIHTDGQMWSSTLMSIWNTIGRTATDENFLECMSMLISSSSQNDAANAFYQADAMLHGGVNQPAILPWFQARGYTITMPCNNIAQGDPASASSSKGSNTPGKANDGSTSTYWRSSSGGTQYWQVDLGAGTLNYNQVVINWLSNRHAKTYQVRVSNSSTFSTFTTVYSKTGGTGGVETIALPSARTERYVRLHMTLVNSSYYAVTEFKVCGTSTAAASKENAGELTDAAVPAEVTLLPNYPNPFNPSTNIRFSLPQQTQVSLKIFNMLGEEVATLVNEVRAAGTHTVTFNASRLTSGVYFSVLQAGEVRQVRRLVFMK